MIVKPICQPVARPCAWMATGRAQFAKSITVTGTLTDGTASVTFPELLNAGLSGGKGIFTDTGSTLDDYQTAWESLKWICYGLTVTWESTADVESPEMVPAGDWHATTNPHAWKPVSPATGTPIVTATYDQR